MDHRAVAQIDPMSVEWEGRPVAILEAQDIHKKAAGRLEILGKHEDVVKVFQGHGRVLHAGPPVHTRLILPAWQSATRLGDVRDYVSGGKGVLPVVMQEPRTGAPRCHSELRRLRVYRWPLRS